MSERPVASIWRRLPHDLEPRLKDCIREGLRQACGPVRLFFRADDVAVPSASYRRMMRAFRGRQVPLNLALVPAWLTAPRWKALLAAGAGRETLWCWHQHGWRHANHEMFGKKQEFGPSRPLQGLRADLLRGRRRLQDLIGRSFYPVFTPPWNRCDRRTLGLLAENGYLGVSRSSGKLPPPGRIAELAVNVDLHTRRETDAETGWAALLGELGGALAAGACGIMLHHQRMNAAAADFLDLLLALLSGSDTVHPAHFRQMILAGRAS